MPRMSIAVEALIAGPGALKWRLLVAFEALSALRASDFPASARVLFEQFQKLMNSDDALSSLGTARSTVHRMTGPKASKAARIFVSLHEAVIQALADAGEADR